MRNHVEQGASLASALRASTLGVPLYVAAIIEAGEAGTGMTAAVENAAELLEARAATAAAIWAALSYPILLTVTGAASIALLAGIVLPRFAELMLDAGAVLPLTTRIVLGMAGAAQRAALPGIVVASAAMLAWRTWAVTPAGRIHWHALLLCAPALGPLRRSTRTARACSTLSALLGAGVPLATALPLAARSTGDAAMEAALLAARERVIAGASLSSAVKQEGALTTTAIRFTRIGEETGNMAAMLGHAARIESADALGRLKRITRFIEPVLILVLGGVVMGVAAALLQAIYGLRPSF